MLHLILSDPGPSTHEKRMSALELLEKALATTPEIDQDPESPNSDTDAAINWDYDDEDELHRYTRMPFFLYYREYGHPI